MSSATRFCSHSAEGTLATPATTLTRFARILTEDIISGCPVVTVDGRLVGIAGKTDLLARLLEGRHDFASSPDFRGLLGLGEEGLAAGGRRQVWRGTLRVKKPGRMRWDYQSPEPKTVAVVGSRLVQWEPEANQVYVDERFDATAMSAAVTFLLGQGRLESEFHLASGGPSQLLLRPKKADPRVESVSLTVGPEGQVTATRVEDGQGNLNQVALEEIRRNVGLKDSDFEVRVPKDAHRIAPPGR